MGRYPRYVKWKIQGEEYYHHLGEKTDRCY